MAFIPRSLITVAKNRRGQAIFELLVFMPFLVFFFITLTTVGDAINSSINQQKVTRSYYMYVVKQNSMIPLRNSLENWSQAGYTIAGLFSFGFRERSDNGGDRSFAPCYKMSTFFGGAGDAEETCDEPASGSGESNYIRVFTFFGLCGETYFSLGGGNFFSTHRYIPNFEKQMATDAICTFGNGGN